MSSMKVKYGPFENFSDYSSPYRRYPELKILFPFSAYHLQKWLLGKKGSRSTMEVEYKVNSQGEKDGPFCIKEPCTLLQVDGNIIRNKLQGQYYLREENLSMMYQFHNGNPVSFSILSFPDLISGTYNKGGGWNWKKYQLPSYITLNLLAFSPNENPFPVIQEATSETSVFEGIQREFTRISNFSSERDRFRIQYSPPSGSYTLVKEGYVEGAFLLESITVFNQEGEVISLVKYEKGKVVESNYLLGLKPLEKLKDDLSKWKVEENETFRLFNSTQINERIELVIKDHEVVSVQSKKEGNEISRVY